MFIIFTIKSMVISLVAKIHYGFLYLFSLLLPEQGLMT